MKNITIILSALFCLFSFNIDAQNYGLDNTDPAVFTKYRVPKTDLRSLWFNTNLFFGSNKTISSDEQPFNSYSNNGYNSNFRFNLIPSYLLLHESEDSYLNFQAEAGGSYAHSFLYNQNSQTNSTSEMKQNDYSTLIDLTSTYNTYFNMDNIFYSMGSTIYVNMSQSKSEENTGNFNKIYSNRKTQNYSVSLGIGIGKLRNVTPVVTAIRFQERMKQLGLINQNLSDQTIEDLAMQFHKEPYYGDIHSRPDKYFWQGIDNVLNKDGVSLHGLNMYADAYLREALNEIRFFRQEGLIAGLNFQLQYSNRYEYPSILSENLNILANPYLEYSHQLNLKSQISLKISLSGGPVLTEHSATKQSYMINTNVGYNYELTDRLVCSIANLLQYYINNQSSQYKTIFENLSLNLDYFVEDNLLLNASYLWNYTYQKVTSLKNENLVNSLNIGFTYYFERGFLIN